LVILLPDANCDDKVKLEEGCRPSGSITVTNDGGTVVLEEAFQAVMVSTFETPPTNPVIIMDLDLNMIDNMFIVSKPEEIVKAEEEQADQLKGDAGLLDFDGLDKDFLESEDLGKAAEQELMFTELDIDFLNVDFLRDLLAEVEKISSDNLDNQGNFADKLVDRAFGLQPDNQFNVVPGTAGYEGKVWFYRLSTNQVSVKFKSGTPVQLEVRDKDLGETVMCLNNCDGIRITITQE
jgi:hypothetical protein